MSKPVPYYDCDVTTLQNGFLIEWSGPIGFGTTFFGMVAGKFTADTEHLSAKRVADILRASADKLAEALVELNDQRIEAKT